LDQSYGDYSRSGACRRSSESYAARWQADAVATGALSYDHPGTRVRFVWGAGDPQQQAIGGDYEAALVAGGTPDVAAAVAPDTEHLIYATDEGSAALQAALYGSATTPGVAISSGPDSGASARFVFATDDQAAAVTCSLDGAAPATCASPMSYDGLTDGPHTFTVTATPVAGDPGSATWSWDADTSAPRIDGFTPGSAPVGASVDVQGSCLGGATSVRVDGVAAAFTVAGDQQIDLQVPDGALSGPIEVTTPAGTATSATGLLVPPTVSGFSPPSGTAGTQVTITGEALGAVRSVAFGGVRAAFVVDDYHTITATVPSGARTGYLRIVTDGGAGRSATKFRIR
jgi:hypothetical protein